jgi:hypothetical protein
MIQRDCGSGSHSELTKALEVSILAGAGLRAAQSLLAHITTVKRRVRTGEGGTSIQNFSPERGSEAVRGGCRS